MTAVPISPGGWGPQTSLDRVYNALADGGYAPTGRKRDFMALCPVHTEQTGSLHVTWQARPEGGLTKLWCHGCEAPYQQIAEALGLTTLDLFDNPPPPRDPTPNTQAAQPRRSRAATRRQKLGPLPARRTVLKADHEHTFADVETYMYVDAHGEIVQEAIRRRCTHEGCRTKAFRQRFTGPGGHMLSEMPREFQPVLYRLPEVLAAVADGRPVWICEGEKDVHAAESLGAVATTNPAGAGHFPESSAAIFAGARVRVVLDRDAAGWSRGVHLHELLTEAGAAEVLLLLPATTAAKSDLTDHVEAGHDLDDLIEVDVADVRVWEATARLEASATRVADAMDEIDHHLAESEDRKRRAPKAAADYLRYAQRWAAESEMAWERLVDAADTYARVGAGRNGQWALEANRLAERLITTTTATVLMAHQATSMPVPDALSQRAEAALRVVRAVVAPATDELVEPATDDRPDAEVFDFQSGERIGGGGGEYRPAKIKRKLFEYVDGCIVEVRWKQVGRGENQEWVKDFTQLINLDLRLEGREYVDESAELEDEVLEALTNQMGEGYRPIQSEPLVSHYLFSYTDPRSGERVQYRVPEDRVARGDFLDTIRVPGLQFDHTRSGKAKVMEAVRALSTQSVDAVQYRGTGWRLHPDHGWSYVHLGGLITARGVQPANQLLQGVMARFLLPAPSTDAQELRRFFFDHSAIFLDQFTPRVGAVLCGLMYCAPIERVPYSCVLQGSAGSRKSGLAALAMHHLGTAWDRRRAAMSMTGNGATLNAARIMAHQAKDAVMFFDDVTPGSNSGAAQARLGEFLQMLFNQEIRDRAERDGRGLRAGQIPHATGLFSSELLPKVGANARRAIIVPLQLDEIDVEDIVALDGIESRMARATLMASYLGWVAQDLHGVRRAHRDEIASYAEMMRRAGRSADDADSSSFYWAGWATMTRFLLEVGAITAAERSQVLADVHEGLLSALETAQDPDSPRTVGHKLRELIASGLRQGIAHLTDIRTDDAPSDDGLAIRLGWRRVTLGPGFAPGDPPKVRIEASGKRVGYVNTETDEVLLDSTSLESLIKASAASLSEPFTMDAGTARRALHEIGILKAQWDAHGTKSGRWRYTVKRTIHCETHASDPSRRAERTMTVLRLSALLGDDDPGGHDEDTRPISPAPTPVPTTPQPPTQDDVPETLDQPTLADATNDAPAPDEEPAAMYDDLIDQDDTVLVQLLPEPRQCRICSTPTRHAVDDVPLHPACWGRLCQDPTLLQPTTDSTAADPDPQHAVDDTPSPVSAGRTTQPAPPTTSAKPTAASAPKPVRTAGRDAGAFSAAVVVADTDLVYFPDGSTRPTPPVTHLGDLAQMAYDLRLGTQVLAPSRGSRGRTDPGVVVVTEALARSLGIQTGGFDGDGEFSAAHVEHPALMGALAQGWVTGRVEDGQSQAIRGWTKMYRPGESSVLVTFLPLLGDVVLAGEAGPGQVVRRLGEYARLVGSAWHLNAHTTGRDLMVSLRLKAAEEFRPHEVPQPATEFGDQDFDWCRPPTPEEQAMKFVHAYDRGGSYLAGVAGLELPVGDFVEYPQGREFDKRLPGYWLIEMPPAGDWRHPHPLHKPRSDARQWVTTPTLAYAHELEYDPTILAAFVWPEHARVLDPWYERMRDARTATDVEGDEDLAVVRDMIKATYAHSIGMLGSKTVRGQKWYYPERRHMIVAKARANLLRAVVRIGQETDTWPLAVKTDTVVYASHEADAAQAWPGRRLKKVIPLGRGLGQFKVEGTGFLEDQVPFLTKTGVRWSLKAKALITGVPEPGSE